MSEGGWLVGKGAVGAYIRAQRELSRMSLRELSRISQVSNAYLSQIERGLHEPSVRVLTAVAEALKLPMEDLLGRTPSDAEGARDADAVAVAIRAEPRLTTAQKEALLAVYESYLAGSDNASDQAPAPRSRATTTGRSARPGAKMAAKSE